MKLFDAKTAADFTRLMIFIVVTSLATSVLVILIGNISFGDRENYAAEFVDATGVDASAEKLVKINSGVQIAGGALLALGIGARPAALALGASLVPTTLASHRFWESETPMQKELDTMGFVKNAAILGGLSFAALDTGGRPSVFWSSKRAASHAADAVSSAAQHAYANVAH